ncbi:hypothetical protein QBC46DRAFT_363713 [Diplogelasinospora grovesii]|uniref:Protein kinase domain-containing protein n=1 Tax=Diplogelasinospora grovesii TaxID=303347 RepID=A0AAN6N865_9PEZI|nr:hypothetical protein QBC46DRAFT_363713 [Diplogelasinospora grovesii]
MNTPSDFERIKRELEDTRQQLKAEKQQEKQRAEEETRDTTLSEYLEACHDLVFTNFTVETNKRITSKGSITNPTGRRCPSRVEAWVDSLEDQRFILGRLFSKFPTHIQAFRSRHYLRTRGEMIAASRVADEEALKSVLQDILAEPVKAIVERIKDEDHIKDEFDIGAGITFETRVNAISDAAQGPRTPDANKLRPDQICAYKRDNGDLTGRRMAYIIEHKAPHKLTLPHLRLGLRPMKIYEDVVNRATRPLSADETAVFQYHADRLAAAAVTQTFDYMIEAGLTYGFLTTGEAIVFLKIDWTHPITLYYHLAEPGPEVNEHRDNFLCCTAVSQAYEQEHGQDDRRRAMDNLKTWTEDYETILRSIPLSERAAPSTSSAYKPRTYKGLDRSPYLLRRNKNPAADLGCRKAQTAGRDSSPDHSDDDRGRTHIPGTPTPVQRRRAQRGLATRPRGDRGSGGSSSKSGSVPNCRYFGAALDEKGKDADRRRHPVDHATWLRLLREQLRRTLDDGVVRLGKQGARGVLLQVTLLAYGYTFVSKATTTRFIAELEHEVNVYRRLQPLQGACVPVLLGAADLRDLGRIYYDDFQVYITYMLFLSWGGLSLNEAGMLEEARGNVEREVVRSVRALHIHGVVHTDVRDANVLWNRERGRAMMIDFEQAELAEPPRPALHPVVPNKRTRRREGVGVNKTRGQLSSNIGPIRFSAVQDDILAAKMILR